MELKSLFCPNCGASLEVEDGLDTFFCKYCGYLNTLLSNSFIINQIVEPQPPENMMDIPGMADEMRRPMMLIVSAKKKM